jgi:DNA polymerase-3 subunit epsilon
MSWTAGPMLGFDTETTGVDVATDRIVTAALVRRDATGTRVRTWLLAPDVDIPAEATAIHGVSTEHARRYANPQAQALDEVAPELAGALREGVPVVAFNAAFDLCLLDAELRRHGLATLAQRLGVASGNGRAGAVEPVLDPLVLDRCHDADREGGRRLADLCDVYRVTGSGRLHTADVDVLATLDLLTAMASRFPDLATADLLTLHRRQEAAYREWAEGHDERRAARGDTGPPTDPSWPVRAAPCLAAVG